MADDFVPQSWLTAKKLAVFLQGEMTLLAHRWFRGTAPFWSLTARSGHQPTATLI
jgi:hypothetical protein